MGTVLGPLLVTAERTDRNYVGQASRFGAWHTVATQRVSRVYPPPLPLLAPHQSPERRPSHSLVCSEEGDTIRMVVPTLSCSTTVPWTEWASGFLLA